MAFQRNYKQDFWNEAEGKHDRGTLIISVSQKVHKIIIMQVFTEIITVRWTNGSEVSKEQNLMQLGLKYPSELRPRWLLKPLQSFQNI